MDTKRRRIEKTPAQWAVVRKSLGITPPTPEKVKGCKSDTPKSEKAKKEKPKKRKTMREVTAIWRTALEQSNIITTPFNPDVTPDWSDKIIPPPKPQGSYVHAEYDIKTPYCIPYN